MSIDVNLFKNGECVEILAYDVVTGEEIIKAHEKIYDKKHLSSQKYHIIDKSKCTEYAVNAQDIGFIAELDKKASKINPDIVMAIIESESLRYSLTELWQMYVEEFVFKTRSFKDRKLAYEWIAENKSMR